MSRELKGGNRGVRQERARSAEEAYQAFCAGEQEAFDQLMEEFQQPLILFVYGYVHSLESAEDVAEDTFVELLLHKGRFRGQSSFKTYLYSVARHKAIDYVRREQRRPTLPLDDVAERSDAAAGPEEHFIAREKARAIDDIIAQLPREYREVLRMIYLENLRYDEIAQVMR
jgi:RNA polymerase sigma-70 factor (ECF subfamily)